MEKRYIVGAAIVLLLVMVIAFYFLREERPYLLIEGDLSYLSDIKDANMVLIRIVYPFSDAQGAVSAVAYLSTVLSAKGKQVIIQAVEGDRCYTNEGNVESVVEGKCRDIYPMILILEGEGKVVSKKGYTEISAPPHLLQQAAAFVIKKVYPDADEVYKKAFSLLKLRAS